jgi:uncharacterized protein (TIGR00290 family)
MKKAKEPLFLAWSGGKDSAFALHELLKSKEYQVVGLVSCIQENDRSVALRGIDQGILLAQAEALGLPIQFVEVKTGANCRDHVRALAKAVALLRDACSDSSYGSLASAEMGIVKRVAFGDVYLDDIRDCREELLEAEGLEAVFPLWHRDTREVSHAILQNRFKAIVTCINSETLSQDYLGRIYDRQFVNDLPLTIDPCGENGEFHTVVTESPDFSRPVSIRPGRQFQYASFYYQKIHNRLSSVSKKNHAATS